MHFIDEQNVARAQIGQNRRQVACPFNGRTRGDFDVDSHFSRKDVRQGGLAQSGRSVKKYMFQSFFALFGCLDLNSQVFLDQVLPD